MQCLWHFQFYSAHQKTNNYYTLTGETKMDNKCEKCGGELIEGSLASAYYIHFYPKGEDKKLFTKKHSKTVCYCCKACGLIQCFKAVELDKII